MLEHDWQSMEKKERKNSEKVNAASRCLCLLFREIAQANGTLDSLRDLECSSAPMAAIYHQLLYFPLASSHDSTFLHENYASTFHFESAFDHIGASSKPFHDGS